MAGGSGDSGITREKRCAENLGEGHVGGIIGGEVVAQAPDSGQQDFVGIALQRKIPEVHESFGSALGVQLTIPNKTAQNLSDLDIKEMRCVE